MNPLEAQLKELIIERYGSLKKFTDMVDMPWTTLDSILKRGIANSNVSNVTKIARELNLDMDALIDGKIVRHIPITTAAAHRDEQWTPEEYQKIEDYKMLLLAARAAKRKEEKS